MISPEFDDNWNKILFDTEKRLLNLLALESKKIIDVTKIEFEQQISTLPIVDRKNKEEELKVRNRTFSRELEQRRKRKWKKKTSRTVRRTTRRVNPPKLTTVNQLLLTIENKGRKVKNQYE